MASKLTIKVRPITQTQTRRKATSTPVKRTRTIYLVTAKLVKITGG
jgi:hypothetical protein